MVKIHKIPGQLPPVWPRQVIFFANILSLFYGNEAETNVLRQEVGTLETYGGRLIPLINLIFAGPKNLLILESKPDQELLSYFQDDLALTLPEIKMISHDLYLNLQHIHSNGHSQMRVFLDFLRQYPADWVSGYVTDEALTNLAEHIHKKTISSLEGSRRGNNKFLIHEYLVSEKLLVFDTLLANTRDEVDQCLQELSQRGYQRAVVKSQIGASGIGMQKVPLNDRSMPEDIPEYLFFEGSCLVQGWLDETVAGVKCLGSPSVQIFVHDNHVYLYDITEQILSQESVHQGNIAPPRYLADDPLLAQELLRQAEIAGGWLYSQGYRGTASVDFHVVERRGNREVRICEINARVTGATYPSILARHFLPNGAWLMRNIRFAPPLPSQSILEILKKEGLLFFPGQDEGIIPINFNANEEGAVVKGQFLFLSSTPEEATCLLKRLSNLSVIQGAYDRD